MPFKRFKRYHSNKPINIDLQLLQNSIEEVLWDLIRRDQNATIVLEDIDLLAGYENLLEHKMPQAIRYWRILKRNVPAIINEIDSPTTTGFNDTQHLALQTTLDCTVTIEVAV